jgi:hypothetical protein
LTADVVELLDPLFGIWAVRYSMGRQDAVVPGPRSALACGLLLTTISVVVVLSRSPLTVVSTNSVAAKEAVAYIRTASSGCQQSGTLPLGTSAIRVSLLAAVGPTISVQVLVGSRVLTEGKRAAGWGVDATVTIPVRRVPRTVRDALVCTTVGQPVEFVELNGAPAKSRGGNLDGVELRMEYLRPAASSWLSLAPSVARRVGLGRGVAGTWIAIVVLALMLAVVFLAARLTLRELL